MGHQETTDAIRGDTGGMKTEPVALPVDAGILAPRPFSWIPPAPSTKGPSSGDARKEVNDQERASGIPTASASGQTLAGLTIIVPCFNEERAIVATIDALSNSLRSTKRPFEIVVVDDGSTDGTAEQLARIANRLDVRIIRHEQNRGYGFSIKAAVRVAAHELIAITDADGTYPNHLVAEFTARMDGADMVVGARTGLSVHVPLARRPAKWVLRKLASYLAAYPIPDLNSGFRVMRREQILRFINLLPDGFSFTTTITLALLTHGHDVRYVPIDYARRVGRSSIRPIRDTLNFLSLIVRTVLYFRPLKVFAPTSAALGALAILVAAASKLWLGQVADVTSVTLSLAAVQLLAMGMLADLIVKRSPGY